LVLLFVTAVIAARLEQFEVADLGNIFDKIKGV